jgi:hypothetical protein
LHLTISKRALTHHRKAISMVRTLLKQIEEDFRGKTKAYTRTIEQRRSIGIGHNGLDGNGLKDLENVQCMYDGEKIARPVASEYNYMDKKCAPKDFKIKSNAAR